MHEYLGVDYQFDFTADHSGDAALARGRQCLAQDLRHRLMTPRGALWCHPEYGVPIYDFIHLENTEVNRLDLIQALQEAVEEDPRVEPGSAEATILDWDLGRISARVTCRPIGQESPLSFVVGYGVSEITVEIVRG